MVFLMAYLRIVLRLRVYFDNLKAMSDPMWGVNKFYTKTHEFIVR